MEDGSRQIGGGRSSSSGKQREGGQYACSKAVWGKKTITESKAEKKKNKEGFLIGSYDFLMKELAFCPVA